MKKGILLISLLLLTLCANLRAQEFNSWTVFDAEREFIGNLEISADEEDDFWDEGLSVPGKLAEEDDYYDENMQLTSFKSFVNNVQNITGKGRKLERAVVALEMETEKGRYHEMCSGALVGPNLVLTAAHCLTNNIPMRVVAVGMPKTKDGYPMAKVQKYIISKGWVNLLGVHKLEPSPGVDPDRESQYDYGFLVLDKNIGNQTGYFGAKTSSKQRTPGTRVYALGYLGSEEERTLWKAPGIITKDYYGTFFTFKAYGEGGMSGGPVIMHNRPSEIIGIVIGARMKSTELVALSITREIVQSIKILRQPSVLKKNPEKYYSI